MIRASFNISSSSSIDVHIKEKKSRSKCNIQAASESTDGRIRRCCWSPVPIHLNNSHCLESSGLACFLRTTRHCVYDRGEKARTVITL